MPRPFGSDKQHAHAADRVNAPMRRGNARTVSAAAHAGLPE